MPNLNSILVGKHEIALAHADHLDVKPNRTIDPLGLLIDGLFLVVAMAVPLFILFRIWNREQRRSRVSPDGRVETLTRHTLEPRRNLYLVRVDQDVLLIASSELGLHVLSRVGKRQGEGGSDYQPITTTNLPQ